MLGSMAGPDKPRWHIMVKGKERGCPEEDMPEQTKRMYPTKGTYQLIWNTLRFDLWTILRKRPSRYWLLVGPRRP